MGLKPEEKQLLSSLPDESFYSTSTNTGSASPAGGMNIKALARCSDNTVAAICADD